MPGLYSEREVVPLCGQISGEVGGETKCEESAALRNFDRIAIEIRLKQLRPTTPGDDAFQACASSRADSQLRFVTTDVYRLLEVGPRAKRLHRQVLQMRVLEFFGIEFGEPQLDEVLEVFGKGRRNVRRRIEGESEVIAQIDDGHVTPFRPGGCIGAAAAVETPVLEMRVVY